MVNIILFKSSLFFCTLHLLFNYNFYWQNNIIIYITRLLESSDTITSIWNHVTTKHYNKFIVQEFENNFTEFNFKFLVMKIIYILMF